MSVMGIILLMIGLNAYGQTPESDFTEGEDGIESGTEQIIETKPSRKVRSNSREKEAEGSKAPNRFEGDPVIRSKYQYQGQPLEVDPN